MEAQGQVVVAGEVDVGPAADLEGPRLPARDRGQVPTQVILPEGVEKGPVPAFASNHDPVLAKGLIASNQSPETRVRTLGKPESYQRQRPPGGETARA